MKNQNLETRWLLIKTLLDETPTLRERCRRYLYMLEEQEIKKTLQKYVSKQILEKIMMIYGEKPRS